MMESRQSPAGVSLTARRWPTPWPVGPRRHRTGTLFHEICGPSAQQLDARQSGTSRHNKIARGPVSPNKPQNGTYDVLPMGNTKSK